MQIGEKYMVVTDSSVCTNRNGGRCPIRGVVIYVHPLRRFAVLEFQGISGRFRESYFPHELTERNRVK